MIQSDHSQSMSNSSQSQPISHSVRQSRPLIAGLLAIIIAALGFTLGTLNPQFLTPSSQSAATASSPAPTVLLSENKKVTVKHGGAAAAQCQPKGTNSDSCCKNTSATASCPGFTDSIGIPTPAKAVDSDFNSLWCSKKAFSQTKLASEQTNDDWIMIDLGSTKNVGSVYLAFPDKTPFACGKPITYTIETSNTQNAPDASFVVQKTIAQQTLATSSVNFTAVPARYVRLKTTNVESYQGYHLGVREFKVYGGEVQLADLMPTALTRGVDGTLRVAIKNMGTGAVLKSNDPKKGLCGVVVGGLKKVDYRFPNVKKSFHSFCIPPTAYPINPGQVVYGTFSDRYLDFSGQVYIGLNGSYQDLKTKELKTNPTYQVIQESDYANNHLITTVPSGSSPVAPKPAAGSKNGIGLNQDDDWDTEAGTWSPFLILSQVDRVNSPQIIAPTGQSSPLGVAYKQDCSDNQEIDSTDPFLEVKFPAGYPDYYLVWQAFYTVIPDRALLERFGLKVSDVIGGSGGAQKVTVHFTGRCPFSIVGAYGEVYNWNTNSSESQKVAWLMPGTEEDAYIMSASQVVKVDLDYAPAAVALSKTKSPRGEIINDYKPVPNVDIFSPPPSDYLQNELPELHP